MDPDGTVVVEWRMSGILAVEEKRFKL